MKLRQYQIEALEAVLKGWEEYASGLVALPTGSGKTEIGIALLQKVEGRALWLAHRDELLGTCAHREACRFSYLRVSNQHGVELQESMQT